MYRGKKKKLVSIVMAVYNGEKYIKTQIESVLAQTYKNLELVIVDDGSTDKSVDIIDAFALDDKRVRLYRNSQNLGITENFFKGLSYSRGELVCFCDQDDFWLPEKIEVLKKILDEDSLNVLVYSDLEICNTDLIATHSSFWDAAGIRPRRGHVGEAAFLRNIMPGCSMMFRRKIRDILEDMKEPVPYMHDHMVFIIGALLGKVVYSRNKLVRYRQHDDNNIGAFYDSIVNSENIADKLDLGLEYFSRNFKRMEKARFDRLKRFSRALRGGGVFLRLSCMRFYLFVKNDKFIDKCLGVMQCFSPGVYRYLRSKFGEKKEHLSTSFRVRAIRLAFLLWVILVFYVFISEFVIYKILKIIGGSFV